MIKRIELVNFMSHERTVIEPAPGLTVLIGPNNVGKSAIVAALQILCGNDNSTYVMRHGEKHCSVTIETDDGHIITWQRKNSPSYVIDGQTFDRLGRSGVPDELHPVLRLARVDGCGTDDFDIHFGAQKSPIFLLNDSPATAARFFASSSDAIRLVEMQKRHNDKVRDCNARRKELEKTSALLNAELAALEPVSELERRCEQLEEAYRKIGRADEQLAGLRKLEDSLAQQQAKVERLRTEATALEPLDPPPKLAETEPLDELIRAIAQTAAEQKRARQEHDALQSLAAPPKLAETQTLNGILAERQVLEFEQEWRGAESAAVRHLTAPPELASTEPLSRLIEDLQAERQSVIRHQRQHDLLRQVTPLCLEETVSLQEFVSRYESALQLHAVAQRMLELLSQAAPLPPMTETEAASELLVQLEQAKQQVHDHQQELEAITKEWDQTAALLRQQADGETCSTCGGPIDPEKLLHQSLLTEGQG